MNRGPEHVSDNSETLADGTEVEIVVVRQLGLPVRLGGWHGLHHPVGTGLRHRLQRALLQGGGGGRREAHRAELAGHRLVARTETTVVTTTPWKVEEDQ